MTLWTTVTIKKVPSRKSVENGMPILVMLKLATYAVLKIGPGQTLSMVVEDHAAGAAAPLAYCPAQDQRTKIQHAEHRRQNGIQIQVGITERIGSSGAPHLELTQISSCRQQLLQLRCGHRLVTVSSLGHLLGKGCQGLHLGTGLHVMQGLLSRHLQVAVVAGVHQWMWIGRKALQTHWVTALVLMWGTGVSMLSLQCMKHRRLRHVATAQGHLQFR